MIVVIGGGPAGRFAAMELASAGREVMLVDKRGDGLGGQCLHQGCMVICALNDLARMLDHLEGISHLGITAGVPKVSYPVILREMKQIISTISGVIAKETADAGVHVVMGEATVNGGSVIIGGNEIHPDAVVIATGTRPRIPDIPGNNLKGVYTAHSILNRDTLPGRMVIIGSGVIAVEYAYIFSVLGVNVTIVSRSTLLRSFPAPLVSEARRDLWRVTILEHANPLRITGSDHADGIIAETPDGEKRIEADCIFFASGMIPNTGMVHRIDLGSSGEIIIDDRMRTSVPHVYAAGDVTGTPFLTPVARREGRMVAESILRDRSCTALQAVPQAIKLRNDLAYCGHPSERDRTVTIPTPAGPGSFWSVPSRNTGRASVSADPSTGKITGMMESSSYASVVSAFYSYLINTGVTVFDNDPFIEVHPSADGTYWINRYLAALLEKERDL